jgi:hypothetical protein
MSRDEAANGLREQAGSCQRLSKGACTSAMSATLNSVAEQFDADVRRIELASLSR